MHASSPRGGVAAAQLGIAKGTAAIQGVPRAAEVRFGQTAVFNDVCVTSSIRFQTDRGTVAAGSEGIGSVRERAHLAPMLRATASAVRR